MGAEQLFLKGVLYTQRVLDGEGNLQNWSAVFFPIDGGAIAATGPTKIETLRRYGEAFKVFRERAGSTLPQQP